MPRTTRSAILAPSSIEAYITFIFGIVIGVTPMNDLLRCLLILFVLAPIIDLCWRSPWTAKRGKLLKWTLTVAAILVIGIVDAKILTKPRTYVFLVPTHELIDAQRRALFIKQSGPDVIHHLRITVDDGAQVKSYIIEEIDPPVGPQENGGFNYPYIWVTPSKAWEEKYRIEMSSREVHEIQEIYIHNTKHAGLQMSTEIEINRRTFIGSGGALSRINGCSDFGRDESCGTLMALPLAKLISQLEPKPIFYENVNGSISMNPAMIPKWLPSDNPETESDARQLTEWQKSKIIAGVSRFAGHKILVLCSHGKYTESYAEDFVKVFRQARWKVTGPQFVEPKNEDIVDVQATGKDTWTNEIQEPMANAIRDALVEAGVKGRRSFTNDPEAPAGTILLWVGHKSPNGFDPGTCLGAQWKPKPTALVNCQVTNLGSIGFVPP